MFELAKIWNCCVVDFPVLFSRFHKKGQDQCKQVQWLCQQMIVKQIRRGIVPQQVLDRFCQQLFSNFFSTEFQDDTFKTSCENFISVG